MNNQYLVAATDKDTGETVYCIRQYMSGEYSFQNGYTIKGNRSKKPAYTLEQATRFNAEDAIATLDLIESRFGGENETERKTWLRDWRIIPAPI